jgi:hypothetical protein
MVKRELQSALADRYTIERELGRGGMATVYLAQDVRHDRPRELMQPRCARLRAWLWRFVRQRGCSPVVTDPVHPVVFVSFRPVWN